MSFQPINFSRPGTLRLATNQTRLAEFRKYTARDYYKEVRRGRGRVGMRGCVIRKTYWIMDWNRNQILSVHLVSL